MNSKTTLGKPSVLVIDDDPDTREYLSALVNQLANVSVIEASDGIEGIKILAGHSIDLVLCDWNMPNMNGIEFLSQARDLPGHAQLPIVMITGESSRDRVMEALQSGITDYVMKPFSLDNLMTKLKALMDKFIPVN